jgi:hypothetical protein
MTKAQILKNNEYENEILELIDNRDEYSRSDLQGVVQALVMKIQREATPLNEPIEHGDQEVYDAITEDQE